MSGCRCASPACTALEIHTRCCGPFPRRYVYNLTKYFKSNAHPRESERARGGRLCLSVCGRVPHMPAPVAPDLSELKCHARPPVSHAGGNAIMKPWCGKDMTRIFDASHGSSALSQLEKYRIGKLAECGCSSVACDLHKPELRNTSSRRALASISGPSC